MILKKGAGVGDVNAALTHPGSLSVSDGEGGFWAHHGGDRRGGVRHADPVREAPC